MNKFTNYIKSSIEELKKVVWPTPKQALKLTFLVIAFSIVIAIVVSSFSLLFQTILQQLILKVN